MSDAVWIAWALPRSTLMCRRRCVQLTEEPEHRPFPVATPFSKLGHGCAARQLPQPVQLDRPAVQRLLLEVVKEPADHRGLADAVWSADDHQPHRVVA